MRSAQEFFVTLSPVMHVYVFLESENNKTLFACAPVFGGECICKQHTWKTKILKAEL